MATEACLNTDWAVVTGASKGLGAAIAKHLAAGHGVGRPVRGLILVARSRDALEKLQVELDSIARTSGREPLAIRIVDADLSDPQKGVATVLAGAEGLEVTLLINCAGLAASCSNFEDTAEAQLQKEMAVNVLTPMYLTRSLLPGMIQRGGTVLNIASVAALLPAPYMATYGASKAWILSWSLALSRELRSTPVKVTCFCPGHFHSDFDNAAPGSAERAITKSWALTERNVDKVAKSALKCTRRGRRWGTNGWINWLNLMTSGMLPLRLILAIAAKLQWVRQCRW